MKPLLTVKKLSVRYKEKSQPALNGIEFDLYKGEILGIVGESGSGKTTLASSILNVLPLQTEIKGKVVFENKNLLSLDEVRLDAIRGKEIGVVFQEPAASFNPVLSIGYQFVEFMQQKLKVKTKRHCCNKMEELFNKVGLKETKRVAKSYPHQLSGGQLQRVMIAMALSTNPKLLIADEPTSSLDVTIESQIVNLLKSLKEELNLTVLFITHNLALIDVLCDRVVVIYKGRVQEISHKKELFSNPQSGYTRELLASFKELEVQE